MNVRSKSFFFWFFIYFVLFFKNSLHCIAHNSELKVYEKKKEKRIGRTKMKWLWIWITHVLWCSLSPLLYVHINGFLFDSVAVTTRMSSKRATYKPKYTVVFSERIWIHRTSFVHHIKESKQPSTLNLDSIQYKKKIIYFSYVVQHSRMYRPSIVWIKLYIQSISSQWIIRLNIEIEVIRIF